MFIQYDFIIIYLLFIFKTFKQQKNISPVIAHGTVVDYTGNDGQWRMMRSYVSSQTHLVIEHERTIWALHTG